jgi:hypothetical protein
MLLASCDGTCNADLELSQFVHIGGCGWVGQVGLNQNSSWYKVIDNLSGNKVQAVSCPSDYLYED